MNDMLPSTNNYPAYVRAVASIPVLGIFEEQQLVQAWRGNGDKDAAKKLVLSHLRLVTSVVKDHEGYGLPPADLAQEGVVGLMKAVHRFDPSKGVRLGTYAWYWIEAEVKEFIIKNWRMLSWGTSALAKKMFFGYRRTLRHLKEMGDPARGPSTKEIATSLGVSEEDAKLAQSYFWGHDVSMDADEAGGFIPTPLQSSVDPLMFVEQCQDMESMRKIKNTLTQLPVRLQTVLSKRYLTQTPKTLQELSEELGVSVERVRQLEQEGVKKLRVALSPVLALPPPCKMKNN